MGIFSGAGAYGSACILLDKVEYVAGDVVSGRVRLSVATRIDRAEPIRMTIEGCETLAYDEEETRRVVVQPREGDENHHSHEQQVKHVNHEKLKYTMLSDAVEYGYLLCGGRERCDNDGITMCLPIDRSGRTSAIV
jgi:hypothetical protein